MSRTSSDVATEDEFILVAYVEDEAARRIQRLYRARQHAAVSKSAQINHVERADAKIKPWILAAIAAFLVVLLASHSPALSVTPPPPLLIAPPPLQRSGAQPPSRQVRSRGSRRATRPAQQTGPSVKISLLWLGRSP